MKPDFMVMDISVLRAYVLEHREDKDAFHTLVDRLQAKSSSTTYPCPNTPENLAVMKQAIREKLGKLAHS